MQAQVAPIVSWQACGDGGCVMIAAALQELWRWGRVLWVCRVPLISVGAGGALLVKAPQALDLFADGGLRVWDWFVFFFLVAVWARILHAVARNSLQHDDWVPQVSPAVRNEYEFPATW